MQSKKKNFYKKKEFNMNSNKPKIIVNDNCLDNTVKESSNVLKRFVFTVLMISILFSTIFLEKAYLFLIIYCIKTFVYKEIMNTVKLKLGKNTKIFKLLTWLFMIVGDFYIIGNNIVKIYGNFIPEKIIRNHVFISFTAYVTGLIIFIFGLRIKNAKAQFGIFALSHLTFIMLNTSVNIFMNNINFGKTWFIFPAILVSTNDIFAYVAGRLFGRTQLIKLSPKKTWEGFIGGLLSTLIVGYICCYLKCKYHFFQDISDDTLFKYKIFYIKSFEFQIQRIYLHACSFIFFASLIAPFGGFFASGFKRAFRIKNFGEAIPGHGGVLDRLDCHFLMGIFTNVYLRTFILRRALSSKRIHEMIFRNLSSEEISNLIIMIQFTLNDQSIQ